MWLTLKGHSLTPGERIQSRSTKLDLMERSATASPEITGDSPPAVGEWIKRLSGPGKGIIWRVKTVEDSRFTSAGYTLQLEHIIATLKDRILPGETTPATITGNKNAASCTARQAINYILSFQSDWKLGALEEEKTAPYSFNGETLFDCIETVCSALKDVYWDFNLSSYPFTLDIRKIGSAVGSEMRLNRNITGQIRKTIDRSGMYTRIFPIGKNNLKLPEGSLSKNTGTYGTIDHTETDGSMDTVDKLRAWGQERLDRHCEPKVTVSVTGLELSGWTGEDLDNIKLNRVCRMPLQKYNTVIRERVTKLSWADADGNPESVTVTLANTLDDVASIIRNISKSGGKSSRVGAQKDEEDHAWIEDTSDHVSLVAEAIIGSSPDGVDWKRVSELTVDETGIHGHVQKVEGDMVIAQADIKINEEAITAEVKRATGEEGKLTVRADAVEARVSTAEGNIGTLTVRADVIEGRVETAEGNIGTLEITATRLTGRVTTAEGKIGQLEITANSLTGSVSDLVDENTRIEGKLVVTAGSAGLTASLTDTRDVLAFPSYSYFPRPGNTDYLYYDKHDGSFWEWNGRTYVSAAGPGATIAAGDICVAINESGESEATINASKIYLLGQTIANTITADYINSKIADMASVVISNLSVTSDLKVSTGQYEQSVKGAVWDLNLVNNQDGSYTLQRKRFNDSAWVDVGTFSRATTPTLSGSWSGGTLTVTSNPAPASTFKRALSAGAKEKQDGTAYDGGKTFYVPIQSYETGVTPPTYEYTGYRAYVDATLTYNSGYTDGFGSGRADGMHEYYTSGNWAAATAANDWYAMIPTETNSGSEPWDCGARAAYSAGFTRGQATTPDSFQVKTSDITGSSVGSVSGAVSGAYICFKVGEYKYYLKLD